MSGLIFIILALTYFFPAETGWYWVDWFHAQDGQFKFLIAALLSIGVACEGRSFTVKLKK